MTAAPAPTRRRVRPVDRTAAERQRARRHGRAAADRRRRSRESTRRWRTRLKRGTVWISFELSAEQYEALFRFGGLLEHEAGDHPATARALSVLLDHAIDVLRRGIARR
jgi:hypothetical protein